jgi:hypothetical protein
VEKGRDRIHSLGRLLHRREMETMWPQELSEDNIPRVWFCMDLGQGKELYKKEPLPQKLITNSQRRLANHPLQHTP